jgi:hypothetical protein
MLSGTFITEGEGCETSHPLCPAVKAPDAVRRFACRKSDLLSIGVNFPNIEPQRLVIDGVFNLDGRFFGRTPGAFRDVDSLDQESLSIHAVTDISPIRGSDFGIHFPISFQ